jgi:cardiolipin synthase
MRVHLPDVPFLPRHGRREDQGDWRYVRNKKLVRRGNFVQPLRSGKEGFPAMLEAIAKAKRHVYLETYILRSDRTGTEFQAALAERARAGVCIRVLYDSIGSFGIPGAFLAELKKNGAACVEYHPLMPWRAGFSLNRRDHQKILIVDDEVAFAGGLNIGDEGRPVEEGGGGWHDLHAKVEGPVVLDLARIFRQTWERAGGNPLPETRKTWAGKPGPEHVADVLAISNVDVRGRWRMYRAYLHSIREAKHTISVMNSYFIPDRRLRRGFARAAARGVSVRVIVPSISDVKAVTYASHFLYASLMRRGVRIFEWPERMMHAKAGIIDGVWSTIGSYNLDRRSLLHNLELALVIVDRKLGGQLEEQFEKDLANCREIDPVEWQKRSRWEKVLEWAFYQVRYWL